MFAGHAPRIKLAKLVCTKCEREKDRDQFGDRNNEKLAYRGYKDCWCLECRREHVAAYDTANPGKRQQWRMDNPVRDRELNRRAAYNRYSRLRFETIEAYGGECECCGEDNFHFLTIDHINGVPDHHRWWPSGRRVTGASLMTILKNDGWPDYMRLLCWNCNLSYANYGYCPHQEPSRVYREAV